MVDKEGVSWNMGDPMSPEEVWMKLKNFLWACAILAAFGGIIFFVSLGYGQENNLVDSAHVLQRQSPNQLLKDSFK